MLSFASIAFAVAAALMLAASATKSRAARALFRRLRGTRRGC